MSEVRHELDGASARRFRPYPAYKGSGIEWLGEIPAHWEMKKWRYCCHVTEGQVAPDEDRYRDRIMIAPNHIESGTGRILFTETADQQGAISGKYLVKTGDLIYSKIRPALNKACIAAGDWLCSADMYAVKVIARDLRARYLLHFILSEPFVRLMVDESMRVAMPKVNREKLAACPLLIPAPLEQDAIAQFLDRETARIDALVAKKERLIEMLQEKRTALITRAVTKGLDPNVTMKDSGVEWLGEIPAHWEVKPLRWVLSGRSGEASPNTEFSLTHEEGRDVAVIGGNGVMGYSDRVNTESACIAIGRVGALCGNVHVVDPPAWVTDNALVVSKITGLDLQYLAVFLRVRDLNRWASQNAQPLITGGFMKAQRACTPLASEQRAIAALLDRETARIDELVARVRDAIDRLKELRTALISAAVTGKIDVREEVAA